MTPFILDAGQCGKQRGQQYEGAQGRFGSTRLAPALLRLTPWQVLISFLEEQVVVGRGCTGNFFGGCVCVKLFINNNER